MLISIVAMVLLSASVRCLPGVTRYCDNFNYASGSYCASCLQPVACSSGYATTVLPTCDTGYVCQDYSPNYAACVSIETATRCQCSSNVCDPFDSTYYADQCGSGGITDVVDCYAISTSHRCAAGSCETCANYADGWRPIYTTCSAGYRCSNGVVADVLQCASGEYFSEKGTCQPAPPVPCSSLCSGMCPDLSDCSQYIICDGAGNQLGGVNQCESGYYFNPDLPGCQVDPFQCSLWTQCSFVTEMTAENSTTLPTCSDSTAGSYNYGPCDSNYWSCRGSDSGNYKYVVDQCLDGLVFSTDPAHPYCVDPTDEDTCAGLADSPSVLFQAHVGN